MHEHTLKEIQQLSTRTLATRDTISNRTSIRVVVLGAFSLYATPWFSLDLILQTFVDIWPPQPTSMSLDDYFKLSPVKGNQVRAVEQSHFFLILFGQFFCDRFTPNEI